MAKTQKRTIGDIGEEIACIFLKRKGFEIVQRNYWKPWGEIDIVARIGKNLRFIEVKSVSREPTADFSRETLRPEDHMHAAKIQRLHRAIQTYLLEKKVPETVSWQLDLACVYIDLEGKKGRVEMIENIIV